MKPLPTLNETSYSMPKWIYITDTAVGRPPRCRRNWYISFSFVPWFCKRATALGEAFLKVQLIATSQVDKE